MAEQKNENQVYAELKLKPYMVRNFNVGKLEDLLKQSSVYTLSDLNRQIGSIKSEARIFRNNGLISDDDYDKVSNIIYGFDTASFYEKVISTMKDKKFVSVNDIKTVLEYTETLPNSTYFKAFIMLAYEGFDRYEYFQALKGSDILDGTITYKVNGMTSHLNISKELENLLLQLAEKHEFYKFEYGKGLVSIQLALSDYCFKYDNNISNYNFNDYMKKEIRKIWEHIGFKNSIVLKRISWSGAMHIIIQRMKALDIELEDFCTSEDAREITKRVLLERNFTQDYYYFKSKVKNDLNDFVD